MCNETIRFGYTHAGVFHADDVFSSALLRVIFPKIKIYRTFYPPKKKKGEIVFDIGMGEFDHHQPDNECRPNGVPYASFGKLWRKFGTRVMTTQEGCQWMDENLVQVIDNTDCTGQSNPLSSAISSMNLSWNEDREMEDDRFFEAVDIAEKILKSYIRNYENKQVAKQAVMSAYNLSDKNLVILNRYMPYNEVLTLTEAKFVAYPSLRGGWSVQCIKDIYTGKPKQPLPVEWTDPQNTINGLTFCHNGLFLATFIDKMSLIEAIKTISW